ncbi:MAG: hypothetical protein HUU18_05235 [Phycisphaerales bacterium]|nr:hypothetical protein [Phycisphaerales bacterium]
MLSAINADGRDCFAPRTEKSEGPFHCPECHKELVLRKGAVVVHHFAHKPPVNCAYGSGETIEHMRAKLAIYEYLSSSPRVLKLDVEKPIERSGIKVRPDVRCLVDEKHYLGIEFQKTSLDPREIERRTSAYRTLSVYVLWIVPWPAKLVHGERYQPRETERYLHSLYFGRVFFWKPSVGIVPVHFDDHLIDVPYNEWYVEGGHGEMDSGGGYEYRSKRFVTPCVSPPVSILQLGPVMRQAYTMKARSLPAALLWSISTPVRPARKPPQ